MHPFEILLKNEKRKFYDRIAAFTFALSGLGIVYFVLRHGGWANVNRIGLALAVISIVSMIAWFLLRKEASRKPAYWFTILLLFIFWIWAGQWWISILLLIIFVLYEISRRPLKIMVAEDLIIYPSFPKRQIHWSELSNLVLKDELLTIDFKNNKIVQQVTESLPAEFNEEEFNEFCRNRLHS